MFMMTMMMMMMNHVSKMPPLWCLID